MDVHGSKISSPTSSVLHSQSLNEEKEKGKEEDKAQNQDQDCTDKVNGVLNELSPESICTSRGTDISAHNRPSLDLEQIYSAAVRQRAASNMKQILLSNKDSLDLDEIYRSNIEKSSSEV